MQGVRSRVFKPPSIINIGINGSQHVLGHQPISIIVISLCFGAIQEVLLDA
jgi:hypothetical protein